MGTDLRWAPSCCRARSSGHSRAAAPSHSMGWPGSRWHRRSHCRHARTRVSILLGGHIGSHDACAGRRHARVVSELWCRLRGAPRPHHDGSDCRATRQWRRCGLGDQRGARCRLWAVGDRWWVLHLDVGNRPRPPSLGSGPGLSHRAEGVSRWQRLGSVFHRGVSARSRSPGGCVNVHEGPVSGSGGAERRSWADRSTGSWM